MTERGPAIWILVIALAALVLLPVAYRLGLDGAALLANDETIYAEMSREMVRSGRYSELRYEDEVYFPRPPASFWVIAAAYSTVGMDPPEHALRLVTSTVPALEVALTVLLGTLLFSPLVGVLGGLLLATSDLFVGYARIFESEPLLTCFVLGALCAWVGARRRPWLHVVYGACLGGALLTKQLVGLLPLCAPMADAWVSWRGDGRKPLRGLAIGVGVALVVALPWHLLMLARYGHRFVDSFFVQSLGVRATTSLLVSTSPTFYVNELWRSEKAPFALLWLIGAAATLIVGLRRARFAELLVGGWAVGPLVLYSLARSRYDYYILLSWPAFALSAAWLVDRLPLRAPLKYVVATLLVVGSALTHLPRNLAANPGMAELRGVLATASDVPPSTPLYVFDLRPYAPRVYTGRTVRVLVDVPADAKAAEVLRAGGMPAPAELVKPSEVLDRVARPSLLLVKRERRDVVGDSSSARLVGESKRYLLYLLPAR